MTADSAYEAAVREQKRYIDAILTSQSPKKIVVAGPGTGKTFLFKELLKEQNKKALTLTFINSLVDDLSLELYGLSDWPAPGSEDTELGVFMGPEVSHGETQVYTGV